MVQRPVISVCIANYNGMEVIDDCLRSVLTQQGDFDLEVVVHDDLSSDPSVAHLRATYPNIFVIESTENVGYCVANNRMASAARGDYLLLLNNDAALLPYALQTLLSEALALGRPAVLSLPQYDARSGELLDRGSRLDPFLNSIPVLQPTHCDVGMVAGACLWINRSLWNDLGGFPPWFGSIAEDLYLCCRARRCGHVVRVLRSSGYRHYVGHSFGGGKVKNGLLSTRFDRRALSERNKTFVMLMCYPTPFMQAVVPFHVALLLLEGLALSLLKADLNFWRRIYWPVVPALLRHRCQLRITRHTVAPAAHATSRDFFSAFVWYPYKLSMLLRHGLPTVR